MMKSNNLLYPSLAQIESRLFGLDIDLLQRVARDDPTLPESFRLSVRNDPDQAKALQSLEDPVTDEPQTTSALTAPTPVPDWLTDAIQRKVAASVLALTRKPAAGMLIEVSQVITPPGAKFLDWQLNSPLHILLDEQSPETDQVWLGWMVSADADYAALWDVVLEADDGPIDPACGMVQLWNPVKLYWPMARRLCGQLTATRMQVLRSRVQEMLFSDASTEESPRPGHIGLSRVEAMPQMSVLSGSPLGEADDPRRSYQAMYHRVRVALLEPARLACEQPENVRDSAIARYWQQCVDWGRQLGHSVLPQEPLGLALASDSNPTYCFVFDDVLHMTLSQEGDQIRIHLNNCHATEPLRLEHSLEGDLQDRLILKPDAGDSFLFDPNRKHEVRWRTESAIKWSAPLQLVGALPP
jgi:hypothetical protein